MNEKKEIVWNSAKAGWHSWGSESGLVAYLLGGEYQMCITDIGNEAPEKGKPYELTVYFGRMKYEFYYYRTEEKAKQKAHKIAKVLEWI